MKGLERQKPDSEILGVLVTLPTREAHLEPVQLCLSFPITLEHLWGSEEHLRGADRLPFSFPPCYGSGEIFPLAPNPFPPTTTPPKAASGGKQGLRQPARAAVPSQRDGTRATGDTVTPISQRAGVCQGYPQPGRQAGQGGQWDLGGKSSQILGSIPARVPGRRQMPRGQGCRGDVAQGGPAPAREPNSD